MKDHRLVRIAMFLLFVAISLVYAVFFNLRGDDVRKDVITIMQSVGVFSGDIQAPGISMSGTVSSGAETGLDTNIDTGMIMSDNDSFLDEVLGTGASKVLSGTKLYYGSLDIFKTLGIRYDYILKDNTYDIFYVYIGSNVSYNLQDVVGAIGGKTVEIYARNDIINNLYFGDRVTFVEFPQASKAITSLFVRMGSDLWFIQDNTGEYKKHKKHIRILFTGK